MYVRLCVRCCQLVQATCKGATIRYRGGLDFLPGHIYLFHKGDEKLYVFTSG